MLPLRDLWFQGHEGAFSKTKASGEVSGVLETMQTPMQTGGMQELHAKEEVGRGGGAHRGWCSVDGELLWVSAWCLR